MYKIKIFLKNIYNKTRIRNQLEILRIFDRDYLFDEFEKKWKN